MTMTTQIIVQTEMQPEHTGDGIVMWKYLYK